MLTLFLALPAAQAGTDTLSGGAGWVGAGLLGLVLSWLLFIYLPAKDKQLKEFNEAKDKQIGELVNHFETAITNKDIAFRALIDTKDKQLNEMLVRKWEIIQTLTKDYKDGIKEVALHCEKEIANLTSYWQQQMSSLTVAIQDLSEDIRNHHPRSQDPKGSSHV
jgi:uncharacterized membrane-anchored protein YhcB (DUF1043 family)